MTHRKRRHNDRGARRFHGLAVVLLTVASGGCADDAAEGEVTNVGIVAPRDEPACPDYMHTEPVADEVRISGVPFLSQLEADCEYGNYLCGYTAVNMLTARAHGVTPTIEFAQKMAKAVKGSKCPGLSETSDIVTAARTVGNAGASACYTMTFDQLKGVLSAGEPVVVLVWYASLGAHRCSSWAKGHMLVVVGYSASRQVWLVHDPLCPDATSGAYRELPSTSFRGAVRDAWVPGPLDKASVILVRR